MPSQKKGAYEATKLFGSEAAYDAIPKAAFAIIAWHLANAYSGNADADGAALRAFRDEANVLADNGILPDYHRRQINRAISV